MTEAWLSLWRQSGLTLDRARVAATTSSMAIVGLVEEEAIFATWPAPPTRPCPGCPMRG